MNMMKVLTFAMGIIVLVWTLNFVVSFFLGTVASKTDLSSSNIKHSSYRAAGTFQVLNEDGEMGKIDYSDLDSRIDEEGCKLDMPGFREEEFLSLGIRDGSCSEVVKGTGATGSLYRLESTAYDPDTGFHVLGVMDTENLGSLIDAKEYENVG